MFAAQSIVMIRVSLKRPARPDSVARAFFQNSENETRAALGEPRARIVMHTNNAKRGDDRRTLKTPATVRPATDWKPEPCLLTREQIRAIVIEQIG